MVRIKDGARSPQYPSCKDWVLAMRKPSFYERGFLWPSVFPNPWGCNDECIYIRTGEKTTPKKVHGCLIRHMMIKGNRISRATV